MEEDAFDCAFGCVDVKRVASWGVRGMVEDDEGVYERMAHSILQ